MSHASVTCKRSLLLAGLVLASVFAMVGVAYGEGFGEIRRFGGPGTKPGDLTPSRVPSTGLKEAVEWQPQHVIGVDPKTNDVFVLEETEEQEEKAGKKSKTTQFFRLQEFKPESGELLGYDEFEFTAQGEVESHAIEGIAIDPKSERLYFLLAEERPEGKEPNELLDEETPAATALFAFKTTPNGKKLEPVAEALALKEASYESTAPVLVGPSAFKSNSQTPGEALLEPRGITVDPATQEVLIAAHIDETPCEEEEGEVNCEPDATNRAKDHYVIERVKENGTGEQRYVDAGNAIKKESEELDPSPGSPVVATGGGSERLLTLHALEPGFGELLTGLAEFPAGLTGAPSQFSLIDTGGVESGLEEVEEEPAGAAGGSLAVDPEEATVLYGVTRVVNEEGEKEILFGISERSAETFKPIGWSGGQRASVAEGDTCALQPGRNDGEHIQIAAGSHGDVFVIVPEYLRNPLGGEQKFPTADAIIEFGPGGKGCPAASVEKIAASVGGKEASSVVTGQKVTLSSFVKQGDAASTVWKLEDETTKKSVTSEQFEDDQYQKPTLETTFAEAGEYKITEEIKTDNLDTPSLSLSRTLKVTGKAEEAHVKPKVTEQPQSQSVSEGSAVSFHAAAEGSPFPTVQWELSTDGGGSWTAIAGATSETLTVSPAATSDNGFDYRAVFTNAAGSETTAPAVLTVSSGNSGGSNGGGGPSGGGGPPPPGGGGVLPSKTVAPSATVASASLVVSSSGAVSLKISCPTGATTCIGSVTLKTVTAVSASKGKKKAILTLGTGSFSVNGGEVKTITLHLSKTARALLAKDHELRARAAVAAHDPAGEKATTAKLVTLRPARHKPKH
jgi:hypothetical protein